MIIYDETMDCEELTKGLRIASYDSHNVVNHFYNLRFQHFHQQLPLLHHFDCNFLNLNQQGFCNLRQVLTQFFTLHSDFQNLQNSPLLLKY